ncbi:MAG: hypothetical protein AAF721_33020 [Myxococcota bacterium]
MHSQIDGSWEEEAVQPAVPQWSYGALGIAMALLGAAAVRATVAYLRIRRRRSQAVIAEAPPR